MHTGFGCTEEFIQNLKRFHLFKRPCGQGWDNFPFFIKIEQSYPMNYCMQQLSMLYLKIIVIVKSPALELTKSEG